MPQTGSAPPGQQGGGLVCLQAERPVFALASCFDHLQRPVALMSVALMSQPKRVAIVGVGLLGGSIGLALKERHLASEVIGVGRQPDKLLQAVERGNIDRAETDLALGVAQADIVVVCTPVEVVASQVAQVVAHAPAGCWVTDVGSTKGSVVAEIETLLAQLPLSKFPAEPRVGFVGSHPLAGDHRSGAEFSRADLLQQRTVVITPTEATADETTQQATSFWESLGAEVVCMSPAEHDRALALTSHLPHLVATGLSLSTPSKVHPLVATGWLDTTRIAAADVALWRQIFASNRPQVLAALEQFGHHLEQLRTALASEDDTQLEKLLTEGKRIRDAVGN